LAQIRSHWSKIGDALCDQHKASPIPQSSRGNAPLHLWARYG
jgi:hypothetical protein